MPNYEKLNLILIWLGLTIITEKSCIQETLSLSTDADRSTDTLFIIFCSKKIFRRGSANFIWGGGGNILFIKPARALGL